MECGVCYSGFDSGCHLPRNLNCGHTFCTSCLVTLCHGKSISCPECRDRQVVQGGAETLPISHNVLRILTAKRRERSNKGSAFVVPTLKMNPPEVSSYPVISGEVCPEQILNNNLNHMSLLKRLLQSQQSLAQYVEDETERCKQKQVAMSETERELFNSKKRLDVAQTQMDIEDPGPPLSVDFRSSEWYAEQRSVLSNFLKVRDAVY